MKYRIKNIPVHSLHFDSYCNRVFGSAIKNCAGEEAYNLFHQTIFGSFLDMLQCNFQGHISKCILMLELEQGNPDEIHIYLQGTILKFIILEFSLISGLKCIGNIEEHLYNDSSKSVKYEKFMAGMFSKFVYTNLRPTHEEVQRLDLPTINGVELNNDESSLSHDTYQDRSGKRHAVDIHTQSELTIKDQQDQDVECLQKEDISSKEQDFEGFSSDIETSILDAHVKEMVNQEMEAIETATLNALVDAVVNQNSDYSKVQNPENIHEDHSDEYLSTLLESAQLEIDAIMQGLTAPVDDIPLEVVKPVDETVNLHSLSDSQIPSNYPDSVIAAHLAAKIPAKRIRIRSRIFKSPYTTDFASGSKALEDESTEFKQTFGFEGYGISDDMSSSIIEEYNKWVLEGLLKFHSKK
ncbi:hypothetical protein FXO37_34715 [Capsicum annuum]|nr:hypothetical protein FXO37_34715 [Capsicum annuum]